MRLRTQVGIVRPDHTCKMIKNSSAQPGEVVYTPADDITSCARQGEVAVSLCFGSVCPVDGVLRVGGGLVGLFDGW